MPVDDNQAVVWRFFDEAINQRNYELFDELVASDFTLHSSIMGEIHGRDAYKQSSLVLLNSSQDFHVTVNDLLSAENDTVVARLTYRGIDTGGFVKGQPATGKPFEFTAIYVWRLTNGKLAELWQEADRLRLMQQLGLISA
jgi:steroid delta-isomerase-like uncharacterized protein